MVSQPGNRAHIETHIPMVDGMRREVMCLWPSHDDGERRERAKTAANRDAADATARRRQGNCIRSWPFGKRLAEGSR